VIAHPGLTANFDAAKAASLAIALLDWKAHGRDYAAAMVEVGAALAAALAREGLPVYAAERGAAAVRTMSMERSGVVLGGTRSLPARHWLQSGDNRRHEFNAA